MKILIDCGHGINTVGKCSPDASKGIVTSPYYFKEYAWAREVGAMVCFLLQSEGYDAELIVQEEVDIPLQDRTNRVNKICYDLGKSNVILISIHVNAAASDAQWHDARGWSIYTSPGNTKSDALATCIFKVAEKEFSTPGCDYLKNFKSGKQKPIRSDYSDGDPDYESNLWMLSKTSCPAVLVENFFQDNREDVYYLKSYSGKSSCAKVMVKGIKDYIASKS